MHEIVIFGLFILLMIRLIGSLICIDFYLTTKNKNLIFIIIGYSIQIPAGIFPYIVISIEDIILSELLLFLNALIVNIGIICVAWGVFSYFLHLPIKLLHLFWISISIMSLIIFFMDLSSAILLIIICTNIILSISYILVFAKRNEFKQKVGKSILWYFLGAATFSMYLPISVYITSQGHEYGLYFCEDISILLLNYGAAIVTYFLNLILLVHLEYSFSQSHKNQLKDKYSHNLGNILQILYGSIDLMNDKNIDEQTVQELKILHEKKLKEAAELIREIRKL